jgi:hypothetical protein
MEKIPHRKFFLTFAYLLFTPSGRSAGGTRMVYTNATWATGGNWVSFTVADGTLQRYPAPPLATIKRWKSK